MLYFILVILPVMGMIMGLSRQGTNTPKSPEWILAYQSFTFKNFTFEESLQKANLLGLKYVEAYPGQKISSASDIQTHFSSDEAAKKEMKALMKKYKVKLVNYGVVKARSEEEWKKVFDFAKEMKIKTITAEPNPDHLDFIEKMCDEYKINVAIHNHPTPSRYWEPDSILKYVEGRSERIDACADVGHWVRSGLDPAESLRALEGRIISLHFKDLNEIDRKARDVPWGTSVFDVPAMFQELKNQKFKGVFSIEYEDNWDNSLPEIAQSIENFNYTITTLK